MISVSPLTLPQPVTSFVITSIQLCVVRVLVGTLDAKDASSVVQKLNTRFPLTDMRHLKRIKPMFKDDGTKDSIIKIIIRPTEGYEDDQDDLKEEFGFKAVEDVQVPSTQPLTTSQFERFSTLWPVVFHRSLIEKQSEMDLKLATDVYEKYKDELAEECGCLIVDPETLGVVGRSSEVPPCNVLDHSVMRAIESVSLKARTSLLEPTQYLCTSFHVLLHREPCFMCSMALVHSRVSSVVFVQRDAYRGALCSQRDCTWVQACNHRYRIYQAHQ